ncbi:DUF6461 domain-containing protein [Streptomyces sp. WMMC500]|uniref:DUF6461 domain-containing protein n=1 Tax=Streptomyces sp. WMMC500 TaxID=3015154 RepID=UPI00248BDD87|nr:DUF6461 domain-containing protein [Streptomyces sp. WMMC500]WBB58797.1 DUF6461 domain-containing protein [Streptomyces sp. WMMC500]
MASGLRWIATAYDLGYTFTLCEGIEPRELLGRMGAEPRHIHELTNDAVAELQMWPEDGHLGDLEFLDWEDEAWVARLTEAGFLSHPEVLVRAGSVPGWAYAIEDISSRAPAYLTALSRGTRAYTVFRGVNGEHQVGYARDGQVLAYYEPGLPHLGGVGAREGVPGFVYSGQELPDVAFLRFLEDEYGIYIAWEDTQAPLPTAAFARATY